ncbi:MAG: helix-turn-helix domain-containing protein, partial [Bacteroidaceae bacterium]|nr:helix-turn-helix domain-containing protein [Bacteroidaceae bacterium]
MYNHLIREQRYVIYLELQRGTSQEVIAQLIDVSKSTVSREIKRNSTKNGKYVWFKAHDKAEERKKRTPGNRGLSPLLRWRIEQLIKDEQWSPRQISGYLAKEGVRVSHEAIYAMIRN